MAGNGWEIREAEDFARGAMNCGGLRQVEEVIAPIKLGLSRNPRGFHETSVEGVWIARTKLRFKGPDILLSHCVWFMISDEERTVTMLWVEVTQPENMDWADEWDEPF